MYIWTYQNEEGSIKSSSIHNRMSILRKIFDKINIECLWGLVQGFMELNVVKLQELIDGFKKLDCWQVWNNRLLNERLTQINIKWGSITEWIKS